MSKKEIISIIKDKLDNYLYLGECYAYMKGFLDALCITYEISWEERTEIEEVLGNE